SLKFCAMSPLLLLLLGVLVHAQLEYPPVSPPKPSGNLQTLVICLLVGKSLRCIAKDAIGSKSFSPSLANLLLQYGEATIRGLQAPRASRKAEKREDDLTSYNWNSFGLRYGKRHPDIHSLPAVAHRRPKK
uniref:Uncharacterized protein n=1 Tax=Erpetoichthys calabaricus TaxID=27687 RepID=A0A8C4RQQ4_ERPCA